MPLYAVRDATDKALLGVASAPDGSLYRCLSEVDNPYALEAKIISETYGAAFFDDDKKALECGGDWLDQVGQEEGWIELRNHTLTRSPLGESDPIAAAWVEAGATPLGGWHGIGQLIGSLDIIIHTSLAS